MWNSPSRSWTALALLAVVGQLSSSCSCGQKAAGGGTTPDAGASAGCGLRTCASAGATCGPIGDGCGAILQCGTCSAPETCGGGGKPSVCGGSDACVPRTCAEAKATCGTIGDGCGDEVSCGTCTGDETCGGGGIPFACGKGGLPDGGARLEPDGGCLPLTCAERGVTCGPEGDGCGGVLQCGSCTSPETCGGAGHASTCGTPGGGMCTARTCAEQAATCGPVGNGCGDILECGSCTLPAHCGGGGVANVCGAGEHAVDGGHLAADGGCIPLTCTEENATCGVIANGCGGTVTCTPGCTAPEICGGGGTANQCGTPSATCTPLTCSLQHATCGEVGDGCGGVIDGGCGTCPEYEPCGGGGVPNQCGAPSDAGSTCTNFCLDQIQCPSGQPLTSISGTVWAPTNPDAGFGLPDPLPGAVVYVPNGTVSAFPDAITCDTCGTPASGSPLVSTISAINGTFTLANVPANVPFPLVIQVGRWRRQITVPAVTQCTNTTQLTADQTRLPRNRGEGDIPHIAMVTGAVDSVECVLRKMGIDDAEFQPPETGTGNRVDLYAAPNGTGAYGALDQACTQNTQCLSNVCDPNTNSCVADMSTLVSNPGLLDTYDLVIFSCVGAQVAQSAADQQNVIDYASDGGRIYATHYGYVWLYDDAPFSSTAAWDPQMEERDNGPDYSTVLDPGMAQWLMLTNPPASTTLGVIQTLDNRSDFTTALPPSETWIVDDDGGFPIHYTFNTPVGADAGSQCGRVVFSDFHVLNATTTGEFFPAECNTTPMTAQEKVLEYMLFDLSNCIQQSNPNPPTCQPRTCGQLGLNCGEQGDGCGGLIDGGCGTCLTPQTCGGGGVAGVCGEGGCQPQTCASQGLSCGPAGNGCGGTIDGGCGTCVAPLTCGGGGVSGACGQPTSSCTPRTCAEQGFTCGAEGDGCGGVIDGGCGTCTAPQTCGGGNIPGVCGVEACTPSTCAAQNIACGPAGDGCGHQLACGGCDAGSCGGGGVPGVCGAGEACTPLTCAQQGLACGPAGDGCGNTLACGTCTAPDTCGGAGVLGACGKPTCVPATCAALGFNCGAAADGCGGVIDGGCGTCTAPNTCGGGLQANVCGQGPQFH